MTDNQLSEILNAFVSRFSTNDIFQVNRAVINSWDAAQRFGMTGQIEAQQREREVINAVIKRMIQHDKQLISDVISTISSGS